MNIKELSEVLKETNFQEDMLHSLVEKGFGSLPARETALTILELILQHYPEWKDNPPEDYELARLLRTSPRKIRGLRDDLAYRDPRKDDDWCLNELTELLKGAERIKDGAYVTFEIDDGLVRDFARKLVRKNLGVFESGLNNTVVKISGEQFIALTMTILPESEFKKLEKVLSKEIAKEKVKDKDVSPIRLFVNSFIKSAGTQAGKKSVDLAFTVLTGGLSDVKDAIDYLKELIKK